jgi:hypothetical protein
MDRLLKDVAREYYRRAFVARDCAERSVCPQTRSYFPLNCSARG